MRYTAQTSGERLDSVVATQNGDWTRSQIKKAIENGEVRVNGAPCTKAGTKLRNGDLVEWDAPKPVDPSHPEAEPDVAFRVVYEDEDLFVIDKPAGLVVHPGAGHRTGTLVNGLLARCPALATVGEPDRPGIVHRLDAETSGLLLVAKTPEAYRILVDRFSRHEIHRQYWAICHAPNLPDAGRFDTPYGRHPTQRVKYTSRFEADKRAITEYRVLQRTSSGIALVTCRLETGRTHQIRVHLSEHGAPILSDPLYAPASYAHHKAISRLALHAGKIAFAHPISGEPCEWTSPFPADFALALQRLHLSVPE